MTKYLCPICNKLQPASHFACKSGAMGGKAKTKAKSAASRLNGAKGGRPKKTEDRAE